MAMRWWGRVPLVRRSALLGAGGLVAFAALWEAMPRVGLVSPLYLPPFSVVALALALEVVSAGFWAAVGWTMEAWGIGLAAAAVGGIIVGIAVGGSAFARRYTHSTIEFLRPIPSVALIPLVVLVFGADLGSTLVLVIYAAFWQVLLQVLYGVQDVDPVARETAHSYGLGRWAELRHVIWPTTLPYLMTGLRLAAAVALILAITGELTIGTPGLGREIAVAQSSGAVALMYAYVLTTGVIGVAINLLARAVERRLLRWHPSLRAEAFA